MLVPGRSMDNKLMDKKSMEIPWTLKDPVEECFIGVKTVPVGEALTLRILSGLIFLYVLPPCIERLTYQYIIQSDRSFLYIESTSIP